MSVAVNLAGAISTKSPLQSIANRDYEISNTHMSSIKPLSNISAIKHQFRLTSVNASKSTVSAQMGKEAHYANDAVETSNFDYTPQPSQASPTNFQSPNPQLNVVQETVPAYPANIQNAFPTTTSIIQPAPSSTYMCQLPCSQSCAPACEQACCSIGSSVPSQYYPQSQPYYGTIGKPQINTYPYASLLLPFLQQVPGFQPVSIAYGSQYFNPVSRYWPGRQPAVYVPSYYYQHPTIYPQSQNNYVRMMSEYTLKAIGCSNICIQNCSGLCPRYCCGAIKREKIEGSKRLLHKQNYTENRKQRKITKGQKKES